MRKTTFLLALSVLALAGCDDTQEVAPERRSGRGESCLVTNDCKDPLLCLAGRCLDEELSVKVSANSCITAECIDDKDCCPPRSKAQQETCDEYEANCREFSRESFYCEYVRDNCGKCERTCEDHVCEGGRANECEKDGDCGDGYCQNGACVGCKTDDNCGKGYLCDNARCIVACWRDEQCGALEECVEGRCEDRGCKTNAECVFVLGLRDAQCVKGECGIPCTEESQCASLYGRGAGLAGNLSVSTCERGLCRFVGCSTNAECGALNSFDEGLAVCVSPKELDAFREAADRP